MAQTCNSSLPLSLSTQTAVRSMISGRRCVWMCSLQVDRVGGNLGIGVQSSEVAALRTLQSCTQCHRPLSRKANYMLVREVYTEPLLHPKVGHPCRVAYGYRHCSPASLAIVACVTETRRRYLPRTAMRPTRNSQSADVQPQGHIHCPLNPESLLLRG